MRSLANKVLSSQVGFNYCYTRYWNETVPLFGFGWASSQLAWTVETTHDEEEAIEISSTSTAAGSSITFTTNLEYFSGFFPHRITQYRQRECGSLLRSSDSALSNSPGTASDISTGSTDSIFNRLFKQFDHVHGIVKQFV